MASIARWVAIPARDEADRLGPCLVSLAAQTEPPDGVVVLLNNCMDASETVARDAARHAPFDLRVISHHFAPAAANAGNARRLAMDHAAALAGSDGVLLTTDADTVLFADWVARNMRALGQGADAVCGRVWLDPAEAAVIPPNLSDDDALERELTELIDLMAHRLDPAPWDPWPRHTEAAGASLAVTVAAYRRAGGIPCLASGEDRAFVDALLRIDARVRHDPDIAILTSARLEGRAPGGMADTIRRRIQQQDEYTDAWLEPAVHAWRRIDFRRRVRQVWGNAASRRQPPSELAVDLGIADQALRQLLSYRHFGAAWAEIEALCPFLIRRRVRFSELPREIAVARQLLQQTADADICLIDAPR